MQQEGDRPPSPAAGASDEIVYLAPKPRWWQRDRLRWLGRLGDWARRNPFPLLLIVMVCIVYANSFGAPFLFDDFDNIVRKDEIHTLTPLSKFLHLSNRPLVDVVNAVNFALAEWSRVGWHWTNLGIHVIATLALYGIVHRTLQWPALRRRVGKAARPWLALAATMVWAVHPLNTQAVTYIIQRSESMMGMFVFLGLYASIRYMQLDEARHEEDPQPDAPITGNCPACCWRCCTQSRGCWAIAAFLFISLGLMSKQVAVVAPLVVLLYDWVFARSFIGTLRRWPLHLSVFTTWLWLLWILRMGEALTNDASGGFGVRDLTWIEYFRTQPQVILEYLKLSFVPLRQCFDYKWPVMPNWELAAPYFVIVGALGTVALVGLVLRRWWGFLGAWFFLTLAPTSSILPILDLCVEHRMYLALAGVTTLVIAVAYRVVGKRWVECEDGRVRRGLAVALIALVGLPLGIRTIVRNHDYRSDLAIWHTAVDHPIGQYNGRAWNNLATTYSNRGDRVTALEYFERASRVDPRFVLAAANVGIVLRNEGRYREAIPWLHFAVNLHGKSYARGAYVQVVLADAYESLGARGRAIHWYENALSIKDDLYDGHNGYGAILAQMAGEADTDDERRELLTRAASHFKRAAELKPGSTSILLNLAKAHVELGNRREAERALKQVLDPPPDPDEPDANQPRASDVIRWATLKAAWLEMAFARNHLEQRSPTHEAHVEVLMRIESRRSPIDDFVEASWRLGRLLGEDGRAAESLPILRRAAGLAPLDFDVRKTLARALLGAGEHREAVDAYHVARMLKPRDLDVRLGMGTALNSLGMWGPAADEFAAALDIDADDLEAMKQLAWIRATADDDAARDGEEAVALAAKAVAITDAKQVAPLAILAAAKAEQGQFADALDAINKAIELARRSSTDDIARLEAQKQQFERGLPIRVSGN